MTVKDLTAFDTIDVSLTIKRDRQGRRIPQMTLTPIPAHEDDCVPVFVTVSIYEDGWGLSEISPALPIPVASIPETLAALDWLYTHGSSLSATPPSTAGTPQTTPKTPRASRAKGKAKSKAAKRAKDSLSHPDVHPSHFPDEVLNAPPPPPMPGGYPTDLGIWENHRDRDGEDGGLALTRDD